MTSHKCVPNNGTYEILGRTYGTGKSKLLRYHKVVSKIAILPCSKHWTLSTAEERRNNSA
jgi:hypothetical protein